MQNNKTVTIFLIKFFGVYALLFLLYSVYLKNNQVLTGVFSCAPITKTVAKQTQFVLNVFGYNSRIQQHPEEVSMQLMVNEKYVARIIEGCNSISIIILFISFIIAFAGRLKDTILFILLGSAIIYSVNIMRIALIAIALYEFPQYQYILHIIIFPAIIYGITFLLWVVWVRKYAKNKR